MQADLVYEEGPGGHNWDFWDFHIRRILDWMLEKKEQSAFGTSTPLAPHS